MKKDNIFKSIWTIVMYFIISIIVSSISYGLIKDNTMFDSLMLTVASIIPGIYVIYRLKDKFKDSFKDFRKNLKSNILTALGYWCIGFTIMIIVNLVINLLILDGIAPNEEANREILKMYPIYSILNIVLIAPVCEELLFRLNFKGTTKKRITYVLVSGLLFGLAHVILSSSRLIDLVYMVPYSILGMTFAFICYDTDNVCSSIFAHMVHNTLSVAVILLGI